MMSETNIKAMDKANLPAQVKMGLCVKNQMQVWEKLLEIRIQLQKSLIVANKMPQKQTFGSIKSSSKDVSDQLAITNNSVSTVLDKLLQLQKLMLNKYPETRKLGKQEDKEEDDGDEEILSDTDDECINAIKDELDEVIPNKRRKLSSFTEEIGEQYHKYRDYRNSVIQKWNDKTKITSSKNINSDGYSVLNHIEHILSDKARLIKRSQLKRSEYTILGQEPVENKQEENGDARNLMEEYNTEVYDDDDFYHQLLRELIEVKSADLTDPVQLSRQWIQLQNLRSKMKRKIDTRATKGRKVRYAVHNKLVNFMSSIDDQLWTEASKNELFNSLFGKLGRSTVA